MKCNVKRARADRLTSAYHVMGNSILAYLDASVGCIACDAFGYKQKRLQDMFNTTNGYLGYMMEMYAEEKDDNRTRAATALKEVKDKLLKYADFNFDEVVKSLPPEDNFFSTWRTPEDTHKHQSREKFISDMDPVAQIYHAELLHWFWLHKGFGRDRLTKLCIMLRQDYNLMVTEYLQCRAKGDAKIQNMLKERQDRLEKLGMEFVEA